MTVTLSKSKRSVWQCQAENERLVKIFRMKGFGERLKIAFNNARNAEIARKLQVSEPAVKNYVGGRIPNLETLLDIRKLTGRTLDWLITGEEVTERSEDRLSKKLAEIAKEQAPIVFADAEVAGAATETKTAELLQTFLVDEALMEYGLTVEPLMPAADRRRAEKFSFVRERMPGLEEQFRLIVQEELAKRDRSADEESNVTGPMQPADRITVPHLGDVDGGEQDYPEIRRSTKIRKTG